MKPYKIPESVLVVIHTADGQVLLLERADRPGFWQSVTGSLDAPDEDPRTAARREVCEETGLFVGPVATVASDRHGAAAGAAAQARFAAAVPLARSDLPLLGDPSPAGPAALAEWIDPGCLRDLGIRNRYEIYAHWRHRYAPGVTHNTEHVFALALPAPVPVRLAPREHLACAWLAWEEAERRCFSPSNAQAIRLLAERLGWRASMGKAGETP